MNISHVGRAGVGREEAHGATVSKATFRFYIES